MSETLFTLNDSELDAPLAAQLRPSDLSEFIGQKHLLSEDKLLYRLIKQDQIRSLILYGPPGCGKTSLAHIISNLTKAKFIKINAVSSSVAELKTIFAQARDERGMYPDKKVILFIDEIHRFNKSQQDLLMPHVESGLLTLIGATTHNPYFSINTPLLSRSKVFELQSLAEEDIVQIVKNAVDRYADLHQDEKISISEDCYKLIAMISSGDARQALNTIEAVLWFALVEDKKEILVTKSIIEEVVQKRIVRYDKDEDGHYDTISAFIKSMRGSDPDATVYWLAKMIEGGEDIRFIMRRMLIFASEDIGLADPQALVVASSALSACEIVGLPECRIILSECAIYMATAPKSNSVYLAIDAALEDVRSGKAQEVPRHLKSSAYKGAKDLSRGKGYVYPHNHEGAFVEQEYIEDQHRYYEPSNRGYELKIKHYMNSLKG